MLIQLLFKSNLYNTAKSSHMTIGLPVGTHYSYYSNQMNTFVRGTVIVLDSPGVAISNIMCVPTNVINKIDRSWGTSRNMCKVTVDIWPIDLENLVLFRTGPYLCVKFGDCPWNGGNGRATWSAAYAKSKSVFVCHTRESVTPKQFKKSKYFLHHTIEGCF